jgi:hypothetical protein
MSTPCTKCSSESASYSFKRVSEKSGVITFYTNPAKAKIFKGNEDLLIHFEHMLALVTPAKRWVWIIDGDGFDTDHIVEVRLGLSIIKLITEKHMDTLQEIKIINPSIHLKVILKVILPFLNDGLKPKFKMLDDRPYSILEFI